MFCKLAHISIAVIALAIALYLSAPATRAVAGDDSWCIVNDEGTSHCYYRTSQDCLNAVASGARGFCNVNSSSGASTVAAQAARPRRRAQ
jgi:hypothetical protein